jgi:hypothetical protein
MLALRESLEEKLCQKRRKASHNLPDQSVKGLSLGVAISQKRLRLLSLNSPRKVSIPVESAPSYVINIAFR